MQKPCGPLLLVALLVTLPFVPATAQDISNEPGSSSDPARPVVPGTQQTDLFFDTPRIWAVEEREDADPRRPVLTGEPDDPARGVVAAQMFTDLAAVEAALLRPQDDDDRRYRPVFNVGALLSTLRFDPPLALDAVVALQTIDAPRLDWDAPAWENRTGEDPETGAQQMITRLSMQAHIPRPDANGTSPPPGGMDDDGSSEDADTGLRLSGHITLTQRGILFPLAGLSPAAVRFTWTLEGPDNRTFDAEQRLRWVFLYDYDIVRTVVRPEPIDAMDGAYLVSGEHRAALRLATVHHPLDPREPGGTIRSEGVGVEVRPSAGGDGPDAEGRPLPSPLVLEAHTQAVGHSTRGYTYSGELRFYEAAPGPDDGDGGSDDPGGPLDGTWPLVPRLWQALFVVAIAALLLVPWRRRATPSTTP